MRSIFAGCVGLFLRISEEKKNKGEFAQMFESGWCESFGRYRVEKSWKVGMSI